MHSLSHEIEQSWHQRMGKVSTVPQGKTFSIMPQVLVGLGEAGIEGYLNPGLVSG